MIGGITVVGCVTGTHIIEDIKVAVPHKIAVYIPAEQVLRSKDLHRSLQSNRIMKLDGGSALRSDLGSSSQQHQQVDGTRVAQLEAENKQLRRELEEVRAREAGLHQVLASLGGQLTGIQGALGRLETQQPLQAGVVPVGIRPSTEMRSEVVGGEAPRFMPSQITPDDVETSIQVQTETSEESNVSGARSKLREMREKASGGS